MSRRLDISYPGVYHAQYHQESNVDHSFVVEGNEVATVVCIVAVIRPFSREFNSLFVSFWSCWQTCAVPSARTVTEGLVTDTRGLATDKQRIPAFACS